MPLHTSAVSRVEILLTKIGRENITQDCKEELFREGGKINRPDVLLKILNEVGDDIPQELKQEVFNESVKEEQFNTMKVLLNQAGDYIDQ
ncbi:hypothetical protein NOVO_08290 [Rickettsiales bacterium Ac37b]|nr:hypothetical protein NOVO_08290 [Rickettsiales bacterium Ac37b]